MTPTQRWMEMIRAEHAQSDRMRRAAPPGDYWRSYAQGFLADPSRANDPLINRMIRD